MGDRTTSVACYDAATVVDTSGRLADGTSTERSNDTDVGRWVAQGKPPGLLRRLGRALLVKRFQVILLAWCVALTAILFMPDPTGYGVDTHVYAGAYQDMLAGHDAYTTAHPASTRQGDHRTLVFRPPPPAALVGGAIASLPYGDWLWFLFNCAALSAAFLIVRSLVPAAHGPDGALSAPWRTVAAAAAWFFFQPNLQELAYGNQQAVVALGMALAAWGIVRQRRSAAGIGVGLAAIVKAWPAVFLLPLLLQRRWRELAYASGFALGVVVLSAAVVGPAPWIDFVHTLLSSSVGEVASAGYNMAPLASILPAAPSWFWICSTMVAVAAAGRLRPAPALAAAIAGFLLFWPVSWLHYAGIALVGIGVLLAEEPRLAPSLALAYVLFGGSVNVAWLPATLLLGAAAWCPHRVLHAQMHVHQWLIGAHPDEQAPAGELVRPVGG